jgi:hypothetical protein
MSDWHALYYPLKPGSEETVKELFRGSGRPRFDVTDGSGNKVGRLLGTLAFVGREKAIRVIEVEGPLPVVAAHMSRQEEVRAFERELEPHLSVPRDMTTPDGARAFFKEATLPCVLSLGNGHGADRAKSNWQALFYPLEPGTEEAVTKLFRDARVTDLDVTDDDGTKVGRLLSTMAFIGNGKALRMNEVEGPVAAIAAHMSRQEGARKFQSELDQYLAVPRDMTNPDDARAFFRDAMLECVLARRHDQEL